MKTWIRIYKARRNTSRNSRRYNAREFGDSILDIPRRRFPTRYTITWEEKVGRRCTIVSQRTRISIPRFPTPSWNNPRGRAVTHTRVRAERGARLTYDKNSARSFPPAFLPQADTYGPGPYRVLLFSFLLACLSVCLSVCPFVSPSILSTFVSSVWPCTFSHIAGISFQMLSRTLPEARDGGS